MKNILKYSQVKSLSILRIDTICIRICNNIHGSDVKSLLRELINSSRQYERIDNLESLFKVLRRKGLYNPHETSVLNAIKSVIDDPNFIALLTKQQNLLSSFQRYESSNIYGEDYLLHFMKHHLIFILCFSISAHRRLSPNTNPSSNNPRRNEIYNEIANFLTPTEFLSFSRCMKLSESEIKEIELQNLSLRTRTLVLLDIFERRKIPMKSLIKILSLIGREDLSIRLTEEYETVFS